MSNIPGHNVRAFIPFNNFFLISKWTPQKYLEHHPPQTIWIRVHVTIMWLGQRGVVASQTLLQGIYPFMKYSARIILCRFKQYLSVKLWSYCCVFGWGWKTRLQHAAHVATRSNTNHRVFFLIQWKTNLTRHIWISEQQWHRFSNTQKLLLYVPYMKRHICVSVFYMLFLERSSTDCGNQSSDFVSCNAESHTVTHFM